MAAYHSNLDEVKAATSQISIDLAAIYAQAQQAGHPSAGAFGQCCTEFESIVADIRTLLARNAVPTADFVFNNILSRALDANLSQAQKLETIRRFLQPSARETRSRNQAIANGLWQRANTINSLIYSQHDVITQLGSNPSAILNRFQTMLNGIGYLSGGYFQRIDAFMVYVEGQVVNNTLVAANIEREVTWIIQFRAQMARF